MVLSFLLMLCQRETIKWYKTTIFVVSFLMGTAGGRHDFEGCVQIKEWHLYFCALTSGNKQLTLT